MPDLRIRRAALVKRRELQHAIAVELRRLRLDTGLSQRAVARAIGVHHSHLANIEAGADVPSLAVLVHVATVLGTDVSVRFYPSSGPRLRDHVQARMVEGVLRGIHPRWRPSIEVAVYRPVRGVIDMTLADPGVGQLAAAEHHSELRAADQQLRWAQLKAEAIASARGWPFGFDAAAPPEVVRLLVLRNTERNRTLARELAATLATAYPNGTAATVEALRAGAGRLPGHAVVWVEVDAATARLLDGPPRGVPVGR